MPNGILYETGKLFFKVQLFTQSQQLVYESYSEHSTRHDHDAAQSPFPQMEVHHRVRTFLCLEHPRLAFASLGGGGGGWGAQRLGGVTLFINTNV